MKSKLRRLRIKKTHEKKRPCDEKPDPKKMHIALRKNAEFQKNDFDYQYDEIRIIELT